MILRVEVEEFIPVNSYFFIDDETNAGFLIDPGAEAEKLLQIIDEKNFVIENILLTHGHFDHIGAANEIQKKLDIPVCMYFDGRFYFEDTAWNLSADFGEEMKLYDVTFFPDGHEFYLKKNPDFKVKLIHTPGHTMDGVTYYSEKFGVAFVGDTIFKAGYGRTDFPGGDEKTLIKTIRKKIFTLPGETILLSGHSDATTVAEEKKNFGFK